MTTLLHWIISAVAIIITAYLLPGVSVSNFWTALLTALVLGLVNTFIRPLLLFISIPINILTLGLFTIVINALLILLTSALVPGFRVNGFWSAVLFSIVFFFIYWALSSILRV